jgi:formate hydrogenlyase transcriptional activator
VGPAVSLSDAALVSLAHTLHNALDCSWLALSSVRDATALGPRRTVDLSAPQCAVGVAATERVSDLLGLLPADSCARVFHLPDDGFVLPAGSAPAGCRAYLLRALHSPQGLIGLLELAWHQPQPDLNLQRLDDLLPLATLVADDLIVRSRADELQARIERELAYLRGGLRGGGDLRTLTGDGLAMRAVRLAIQQVAPTDSTVLILGETGTGKELVARAIHQLSPRRDRLLVAVNCAALAPSVIASELFGHEAGAFTGATRRRVGRFELAHHGTLFLDEIGELTPDVQVMLLRVLQERAIERVGSNTPVPVDVRLIAATHQDFSEAVRDGRFRADLFYRLNVFPIQVPPLRQRPGDVADLTRHFLHVFNRRMGKRVERIGPESLRLLTAYPWPGNVRELENLIERAMIMTRGAVLSIDPSWLPAVQSPDMPAAPPGLRELERRSIVDALSRAHGRIYGPQGAAALLGVKPTTLYGKMRRHGIRRNSTDV